MAGATSTAPRPTTPITSAKARKTDAPPHAALDQAHKRRDHVGGEKSEREDEEGLAHGVREIEGDRHQADRPGGLCGLEIPSKHGPPIGCETPAPEPNRFCGR